MEKGEKAHGSGDTGTATNIVLVSVDGVAVFKSPRRLDEMMGVTGQGTIEVEVKEKEKEKEEIDMIEAAVASRLDPELVEAVPGARERCFLYALSTMRVFESLCPRMILHVGSLCWTLRYWCSMTRHKMFKMVSRTPIFTIMF